MQYIKLCLLILIMLSGVCVQGQSIKAQQGAVLKGGSSLRISGAMVQNKRSKYTVSTNQMGIFSILASVGDTLEVYAPGYTTYHYTVTDFKDVVINLREITQLREVTVTAKSLESELNEIKDAYRSKGVYYGGKAPALKAIASPLTFVNQVFGKSAKQARRFNEYADRELSYQEVSQKFNDLSIKRAVPEIPEDEVTNFRLEYMPTVDQIRLWNDYDLVVYIRKSYEEFKRRGKPSAPVLVAPDSIDTSR